MDYQEPPAAYHYSFCGYHAEESEQELYYARILQPLDAVIVNLHKDARMHDPSGEKTKLLNKLIDIRNKLRDFYCPDEVVDTDPDV